MPCPPPCARHCSRAVADRERRDRREAGDVARTQAARLRHRPVRGRARAFVTHQERRKRNADRHGGAQCDVDPRAAHREAPRFEREPEEQRGPSSKMSTVIGRLTGFASASSRKRGPTAAAPSGRYCGLLARTPISAARAIRPYATQSSFLGIDVAPVHRSVQGQRPWGTAARPASARRRSRASLRRRPFESPRKRAGNQRGNAHAAFRIDARRNALDTTGFARECAAPSGARESRRGGADMRR